MDSSSDNEDRNDKMDSQDDLIDKYPDLQDKYLWNESLQRKLRLESRFQIFVRIMPFISILQSKLKFI